MRGKPNKNKHIRYTSARTNMKLFSKANSHTQIAWSLHKETGHTDLHNVSRLHWRGLINVTFLSSHSDRLKCQVMWVRAPISLSANIRALLKLKLGQPRNKLFFPWKWNRNRHEASSSENETSNRTAQISLKVRQWFSERYGLKQNKTKTILSYGRFFFLIEIDRRSTSGEFLCKKYRSYNDFEIYLFSFFLIKNYK